AALGRYRQAATVLDAAVGVAEKSGDQSRLAWILARLGNVLIATGPPGAAENALRRGLQLAQASGDSALAAGILNDLGNALAAQSKPDQAVTAYRDSATLAEKTGRSALVTRARLNEAVALRRANKAAEGRTALDDAFARLERAPDSRQTAFDLVSLGIGYRELRAAAPAAGTEPLLRASQALSRGLTMAESLGDRRTASYARGYLGTLY